jgi:hypothetical protein
MRSRELLFPILCDPVKTIAGMREQAVDSSLTSSSISSPSITSPRVSPRKRFRSDRSSIVTTGATPARKRSAIDSIRNFGPALTKAHAERILLAEVKATLARQEPLNRLLDDHVRSSLLARHEGMKMYLPTDISTIVKYYVVPIDFSAKAELEKLVMKYPGCCTIGFDGASVNGKQKVRYFFCPDTTCSWETDLTFTHLNYFPLSQIVYTYRKGPFCIFLTWNDLGSTKHSTSAEIQDAINVCTEAVTRYKAPLASIDVDNAARHVAAQVALAMKEKTGATILVTRDPAHCVDLCSKDLATTKVVKRVMNEAKEVRDFCKTDRIDSIRLEMDREGDLEHSSGAVDMASTRM